jgi:hypothetical protein
MNETKGMILVYHKFVVDIHNLQDLKRKSGFRSSDNSPFFGFYCLSSKLFIYNSMPHGLEMMN